MDYRQAARQRVRFSALALGSMASGGRAPFFGVGRLERCRGAAAH